MISIRQDILIIWINIICINITKDELKNINKENDKINTNMINNKNNKDLKIQKSDAIIIKNRNLSKLVVDEIKKEKNINEINIINDE